MYERVSGNLLNTPTTLSTYLNTADHEWHADNSDNPSLFYSIQ